MKKCFIMLLVLLIVTGCSKSSLDKKDYDKIFDTFLSYKTSMVNNYSIGYKYYLPTGVKIVKKTENNEKLSYNGYDYYLYVDIVGYHYKSDIDYVENNYIYYSKILDYNGISGYVNIEQLDQMYKIDLYYNYARIESYSNEDDLGQNLINMCYILNSIDYNDSVIKLSIENESEKLSEETYNYFIPKKEGNFVNYINQYDEYEKVDEEIQENNIGNEGKE